MSVGNESALAEAVRECHVLGEAIIARGHGSKDFYGNRGNTPPKSRTLCTAEGETALCGVIEYEPSELFVGAWAGTPLSEVRALLAENRQMLAFDPPMFGGGGTVGGAVAAGLAGPGRACYGGVRDAMLGVSLVNGLGELLNFGGRVIKNVAGYDISRLSVGAMGTLGLITRAFLRVAPVPAAETTRALEMEADAVAGYLQKLSRDGVVVSATFYDGEVLHLRLASSSGDISKAAKAAGGEEADDSLWAQVRDHEHPFFTGRETGAPLWRLSMPPGADIPVAHGEEVCEWNGALIWSREAGKTPQQMRESARDNGGSACMFYKGRSGAMKETFERPPDALMRLHRELKKAFDPKNILNPARLHRGN